MTAGGDEARGTVLTKNGAVLGAFEFEDRLRADVEATVPPAFAGADVSIAPSSAADVRRNADCMFLRESLAAVPYGRTVARDAGRLIRQNLAFAVAYNAIAVPVAILGYATPLVAAAAMSLSSVLVVANALRLRAPREAVYPAGAAQGATR